MGLQPHLLEERQCQGREQKRQCRHNGVQERLGQICKIKEHHHHDVREHKNKNPTHPTRLPGLVLLYALIPFLDRIDFRLQFVERSHQENQAEAGFKYISESVFPDIKDYHIAMFRIGFSFFYYIILIRVCPPDKFPPAQIISWLFM